MSQTSCTCKDGGGNTGLLGCTPMFGKARRIIFVRPGVANALDPNVEITQQFITDKINHDDPDQRWYITPDVELVSERADPEVTTRDSGAEFINRKGIRTDTIIIDDVETVFLGKLEKFECGDWAIFYIGQDNKSIEGKVAGEDGLMYPRPVQKVWTNWMREQDTQPQAVNLYYNWKPTEKDSLTRFVSEIPGTFEDVTGLLDLSLVNGSSTTATSLITFTPNYDYGPLNNIENYEGLLLADIADVSNVSSSTTLTPVNIEPNEDGSYALTITEASTGNAGEFLEIELDIEGYDASEFNETQIEITA